MIVNRQMPSRFKPKFPVSLNRQSLQSWGLVACYPILEGGGTTLFDVSGSGLNATNVGGPTWGIGLHGTALTYNGSTQYSTLVVNTAPASVVAPFKNFANNASTYSFTAWIKTSSAAAITTTAPWSTGNNIIEGRNDIAGVGHAWSFGTEGGKLSTSRTTSSGSSTDNLRVNSTSAVNDNKWHFVVATVSTNAVSMYVDGKLNNTGTFAGLASGDCSVGSDTGNVDVQLGARTTNAATYASFFNGSLDDVRIYNRMLQPTEVQQMYINPCGLFSVSPSPRYWYFTAATPPPPPAAATSQYLMLLGVGT